MNTTAPISTTVGDQDKDFAPFHSSVSALMETTSTVSTTVGDQDKGFAPHSSISSRTETTSTVFTTVGDQDKGFEPHSSVSPIQEATSTVSTTVAVFEIQPETSYCPPINDTKAIVNSSAVVEGTVIQVSCQAPYKLVVTRNNMNVFTCSGGHWRPLTPTCSAADSSAPVAVIVGCSIGGFVCLVLVVIALFMLHKSLKDRREQRDRNKEFNDKMDQIGFYVNSTFQDSVGMPVLTMDTRDPELRGRVAQTTNSPSASPEKTDPPDAVKLGADLF